MSDLQPFDEARSREQIEGLIALLAPAPKRVLDAGCGAGRVLVPLVSAGHEVVGIDRDAEAVARCREAVASLPGAAAGRVRLRREDFVLGGPEEGERFDAVCCLGNTFMTVVDVHVAVGLLARWARSLSSGGLIVLDDIPGEHWPELVNGNWQNGLSDAGDLQMVWAEDDAVFALRRDDRIDPDDWTLRPDEARLRLWTMGALTLAAGWAGLSESRREPRGGLLIMRSGPR